MHHCHDSDNMQLCKLGLRALEPRNESVSRNTSLLNFICICQLEQKQPGLSPRVCYWNECSSLIHSQCQRYQPLNVSIHWIWTPTCVAIGKYLRQRALDYSNTKAWGMSFAFVCVCFFFCPFESEAKLVSEGYANFRRRMAVWLPEKLLFFTVAPTLNRARRF